MNPVLLIQKSMNKSTEQWKHQIILTNDDLREWLKYERLKYSSELSFCAGGYALLKRISFGNIKRDSAKRSITSIPTRNCAICGRESC